jgi:hypothetical protein
MQVKRTATDLRANLYQVLDHVAATGEVVHVTRGGVELCIVRKEQVPARKKNPRTLPDLIVGDPDSLVHMEWPWNEGRDL